MSLRFVEQRFGLSVREIDGELVILDKSGGFVYQLNSTAKFIWERCNGQLTVGDIASEIVGRFHVSPEAALNDVASTIADLQKLNLVFTTEQGGC